MNFGRLLTRLTRVSRDQEKFQHFLGFDRQVAETNPVTLVDLARRYLRPSPLLPEIVKAMAGGGFDPDAAGKLASDYTPTRSGWSSIAEDDLMPALSFSGEGWTLRKYVNPLPFRSTVVLIS